MTPQPTKNQILAELIHARLSGDPLPSWVMPAKRRLNTCARRWIDGYMASAFPEMSLKEYVTRNRVEVAPGVISTDSPLGKKLIASGKPTGIRYREGTFTTVDGAKFQYIEQALAHQDATGTESDISRINATRVASNPLPKISDELLHQPTPFRVDSVLAPTPWWGRFFRRSLK
jgi:hypothetical protein